MIIEYTPEGRIIHTINDPVPPGIATAMTNAGATFLETPPGVLVDIMDDYVKNGVVLPRPTLDIQSAYQAPVGAEVVLAGLPEDCRVIVDGQEIVVSDGELVLESDLPATYQVIIDHFPYQRAHAEVTFDAA